MLKWWIKNHRGYLAVEYMLLFAAVIIVLMVALSPNGFFRNEIDASLNQSINGISIIAEDFDVPYEPSFMRNSIGTRVSGGGT